MTKLLDARIEQVILHHILDALVMRSKWDCYLDDMLAENMVVVGFLGDETCDFSIVVGAGDDNTFIVQTTEDAELTNIDKYANRFAAVERVLQHMQNYEGLNF